MTAQQSRFLEHINITVADPAATAGWLKELFGWSTRWEGEAKNGGHSIHVGNQSQYIAVYGPSGSALPGQRDAMRIGNLNHVGIVTDDLDGVENKAIAQGFKTYSHADYEPGRRFYFLDDNGIEFEIVSYAD